MAQLKDTTITGNGIISGTLSIGGMASNIDMNDYSISEINELSFNDNVAHIQVTGANTRLSWGSTASTHDYLINIGYINSGVDRSVNIGVLNNATGNYAVNLGYDADSGATKTVSIGYATDATEESNIAIGDTAQATGTNNAIAIGTAIASANKAISIGELSQATQTSSVALGYGAQATGGYGCIAIGPNSTASGTSGFAMGYQSSAAAYGIGLGASANSSANYANALGFKSAASGVSATAIGCGATTAGQDGPTASGRNSIAIGGYNAVTTSVGAIASAENAVAIGAGCSNAVANSFKVGGDINHTFLDTSLDVTNDIKNNSIPVKHKQFWETDFMRTVITDPWYMAAIQSGTRGHTGTSSYLNTNTPGVVFFRSHATTDNSGYSVRTDVNALQLGGNEKAHFIFLHSQSNSNIQSTLGFYSSDTQTESDAVCFKIDQLTLKGHTASNSVRSDTDTTYDTSINTWYNAYITLNDDATEVTFELWDSPKTTLLWTDTLTNNIPTAAGRFVGHGAKYLWATNDGTAQISLYMDYMSLEINRVLNR